MKQTLFCRDFTLVVIGQIISLFGNAALRLALPLYLLDATGSEALFGLVSACAFGAMVLTSPLGGAAADRLPKARMMAALDFITCLLSAGLALLLERAPLVPLLLAGLVLLYGIQGAYQPAVNASVPLLVPEERLVSANGVISQVNALSQLAGPVLGGLLYSGFGLEPVLWLSGCCFLISAVMELLIHIPHPRQEREQGVLSALGRDTAQAARFLLRRRPELARGVGLVCLVNLVMSALIIVGLPILIRKHLGLDSGWYGMAEGAMALGSLLGGVLAGALGTKLTPRLCPALLALCGLLTMGMSVPLALGAPVMLSYGLITGCTAALMALAALFSIVMLSHIQGQTPEHLLGKVMAWVITLSMCASPVGQALYGALFQTLPAWRVVCSAGAAACLIALLSRPVFQGLSQE